MFVKIMSDEDMPDSDSRKTFRLLSGVEAVFINRNEAGVATVGIVTPDGGSVENHPAIGNVYLMNDAGKTIASFGCAPYRGPRAASESFPLAA